MVVAGIHLSDIPALDYQRHLFTKKPLTSVTSTTRAGWAALMRLAARLPLQVVTTPYPFEHAVDRHRKAPFVVPQDLGQELGAQPVPVTPRPVNVEL